MNYKRTFGATIIQARGRHKPGVMNHTESRYAEHLEQMRMLGSIAWYSFESITLKLASDCRYTPDFVVMLPDGLIEMHEVKGFWRDDAKVKIKIASSKFPFRFLAFKPRTKKQGGGWIVQEF